MTSLKEEVARQLKTMRQRKKVSQLEMAKRLKVNQSRISEIESGKMNLTLETIEQWNDALGSRVWFYLTKTKN